MDSIKYQCSLYQMNWYEWINNSILNEWNCMNIHDSIQCIDFFNNHCLWIVDYENGTIDSFWYFHQLHKWYWMNIDDSTCVLCSIDIHSYLWIDMKSKLILKDVDGINRVVFRIIERIEWDDKDYGCLIDIECWLIWMVIL